MAVINDKMQKEKFSNIFLLVILLAVLYLCFLLFRPFLNEIVISGVLVTIFYPVYLKFVYWTKGRLSLSALIVCILILLLIIVPCFVFLILLAQQITVAIPVLITQLQKISLNDLNIQFWQKLNIGEQFDLQQAIIDSISNLSNYVWSTATLIIKKGSEIFANFIFNLILIFFTMFFMFRDGRSLLTKLMQLTPLSNKYDKLIWTKFKDVSYTTIVATVITALVQGAIAALGFGLIGLSGLLIGVFIFMASFFPYVGTAMVWLPIGIYLILSGNLVQGIFVLLWGGLVISLIDNFLKPYLIKDKAQVHPLIIFFSIFGGILLMGMWGVIFGPLIVAITFTILHIYELQYSRVLER